MKRCSPEEMEIIRSAWADDTIENPLLHAAAQLDRTSSTITVLASQRGWARERIERRQAARSAEAVADKEAKLAEIAAKKAETAKARAVERATKAREDAKAKMAEAERLAKEAGIAPLALKISVMPAPAARERIVAAPVIKNGRCDRGERALIFKRLTNFVIPQLANETGRGVDDVKAAIATIVAGGFKPEVSTYGPGEWVPQESFHGAKA